MTFFGRLFGWNLENDAPVPDEASMKSLMEEAKQKNKEAVAGLASLADRQVRDAVLIRQIIKDMLDRANHTKPVTANGKSVK
jgi:hypothetical protein